MRFASEYWRDRAKQTGGAVYARIINTSSEAFIFGSPGQPNYAAAKAGIVAMTMSTAQVLQKYGVTANVDHAARPHAHERLRRCSPRCSPSPRPASTSMRPENVSPLVAWLGSREASQVSGYVMVVYGKEIVVIDRPTFGQKFVSGDAWTVDSVGEQLGAHFAKLKPVADGFTVPAV